MTLVCQENRDHEFRANGHHPDSMGPGAGLAADFESVKNNAGESRGSARGSERSGRPKSQCRSHQLNGNECRAGSRLIALSSIASGGFFSHNNISIGQVRQALTGPKRPATELVQSGSPSDDGCELAHSPFRSFDHSVS